jgi:NtrC-family two-component system sensor histidine kinase KinB
MKGEKIMKIQSKLILGVLFLFAEFLIISLFSSNRINNISKQSERIMKDNNLSLQYSAGMLQAIERINTLSIGKLLNQAYLGEDELSNFFQSFEENLNKESHNVTEEGEKEMILTLTTGYEQYKTLLLDMDGNANKDKSVFYFRNIHPKYDELRSTINHISDINMKAIVKKNEDTIHYENRSYVLLIILVTFCFLISISFIYNFPGFISQPVKKVLESLKKISNEDYDVWLNFNTKDEFMEIENYIKIIIERLQRYENSKVASVVSEEEHLVVKLDHLSSELRNNIERMKHLDVTKMIEEQSRIAELIKTEIERTKHKQN